MIQVKFSSSWSMNWRRCRRRRRGKAALLNARSVETRPEIINEVPAAANRNHDHPPPPSIHPPTIECNRCGRKAKSTYIDNTGALALLLLPRCNRKCSAKETDPWLSNLLLYYSSAYVYSCLLDYFAMQEEEEEERAPSRKNEESPGECTTTRDCWRRCYSRYHGISLASCCQFEASLFRLI